MSEVRPRNINTSGILKLMRSGGDFARLFDDGPKASPTDPIKMYRGEALRKTTETLVPDELVGKFNTPNMLGIFFKFRLEKLFFFDLIFFKSEYILDLRDLDKYLILLIGIFLLPFLDIISI